MTCAGPKREEPDRTAVRALRRPQVSNYDAGAYGALTPVRRGPKAAVANPLAAEVALLQRRNADLTRRLARAETIIDVQKKVAALLGLTPDGGGS